MRTAGRRAFQAEAKVQRSKGENGLGALDTQTGKHREHISEGESGMG